VVHLASSQETVHAALQQAMTSGFLPPPRTMADRAPLAVYTYPKVNTSPPFPFLGKAPAIVVAGDTGGAVDPYVLSATSLSYSRTLDLLRRKLGPHFPLEDLWERHTYYEFVERDASSKWSSSANVFSKTHVLQRR
jgi:hypothetical protein